MILYFENNQRRYKKWKFPIILNVINRGGIDVMLIKCPECGKEISNKSEQCIHCGFPIRKSQAKNICKNTSFYDYIFYCNGSFWL